MSTAMEFSRQVIYSGQPSERTLCVVGDVNGDGMPEVVIGARSPRGELYWVGRTPEGTWQTHLMDDECGPLEAGGVLVDIAGSGRLDFVAGEDATGDRLCWWENPEDPTQRWVRREIAVMSATKSHDQLAVDLDGDGRPEVYWWNQGAQKLLWATIPEDCRQSPWPSIQEVATGVAEEGLAAADLDGDGRPELIAGQSWYRLLSDGSWERHAFTEGYVSPKVAAADFDGDGRPEIILSEGDASLFTGGPGRLVRFRSRTDVEADWEPEILSEALLDPHTLQVADFDGDGRPDLLVAELGDPNGRHAWPPSVRIFFSGGYGFHELIVEEGVSVHEGKAFEFKGRVGIVGKPYQNVSSEAGRAESVDQIHLWLPEGMVLD